MAYAPQTWVNGSGGGTPLDDSRLNHMEAGVEDADTRLTSLEATSATQDFATSRAVALAMVLGS